MTTKDEALALALEALETIIQYNRDHARDQYGDAEKAERWACVVKARAAITAIKQAQGNSDSTCKETLRLQGKAYPRTCKKCGLGPCIGKPIEQAQEQKVKLIPTAEEMGTPTQPQAITPETGNAANPEASAITAGNGQQAQEPVPPEKVESAWRAGWAACRDAEYGGQEAEDEAWGMSETCANADWESAAPKALEPQPDDSDVNQVHEVNAQVTYAPIFYGASAPKEPTQ